MPRLSSQDRGIALGMVQAGLPMNQVAARFNVSHVTIINLMRRFQETGSVADRPRTGQPRVTDPGMDRHIVLTHLRNRFQPASVTARTTEGRRGNISERTVRRRLTAANLSCRRPYVGPILTRPRREARLQWANQYRRWTLRQWDGVLFSDESRFCVSQADGRIRVWRRPGERYADCCVNEVDRWGGPSVMVWGGITTRYRTTLHVFDGNVNARSYQNDVLQGHVVPFFQMHEDVHTFQQDNARAHTAIACTTFLMQQTFEVLPWPAYSPDLSPIEHLWDELGRRVNTLYNPRTRDQLRDALIQEWNSITQQSIYELTRSMRRRITSVIDARGGHNRY